MKNKIFILFILIFVLGTSSVFASVELIDLETATAIINYAKNNMVMSRYNNTTEDVRLKAVAQINQITPEKFMNSFNNKAPTLYPDYEITLKQLTLMISYHNDTPYLWFFISNNQMSNDLDFLYLNYLSNNGFAVRGINSIEESTVNPIISFYVSIWNGAVNNINTMNWDRTYYSSIPPTTDDVYFYHPSFVALTRLQDIAYSQYSGVKSWYYIGNYVSGDEVISGDYVPVIPPVESGDSSGDNSGDTGGGTVTPSGDNGGTTTPDYSEKLDNIENKIPTSGDIKESTTQGVITGNTSYWGSSGDLTGEEQEDNISGEIIGIIDSLSGDLAKNEIFNMLDTYQNKLWGSFKGENDFKISWNAVNYEGVELIPAYEINFTQLCKDIEVLGYVKSVLNIIISFHVILSLISQIYNLILSTLGIDNPFLYESENYTEIINPETGEYTEKVYRNRRIYRR